jgi:hypothetical protein
LKRANWRRNQFISRDYDIVTREPVQIILNGLIAGWDAAAGQFHSSGSTGSG